MGYGATIKAKKDTSYLDIYFTFRNNIEMIRTDFVQKNDKYIDNGVDYHFDDDTHKLSHFYTYKNNKLEGPAVFYYDNGLVERIEYYKNGEGFGVWKYFDVNGNKIKEVRK